MSKLQGYTYDELVYQKGWSRRYPLTAYVQKAVASHDIKGLEHAGALVESGEGVVKTTRMEVLALVKAFLKLDYPATALRYWNVLTQRVKPEVDAWRVWLDHAFQKRDEVAHSVIWNMLSNLGISRSSEMWCQRLLLLHRINQPSSAWSTFCTLLRYSGKNRQLLGEHIPLIAPSKIDLELFHVMIQAYLERKDGDTAKATEVWQLLKKHNGLQATRKTCMLFIEDSLRRGARDLAVGWYVEGRSSQVRFSPEDYAPLFEYDLNKHGEGQKSPLPDYRSDILRCFEAISSIMRMVRGGRLFSRSAYRVETSASSIPLILKGMPLEEDVDDVVKDPITKETQSAYAGLIKSLAQNFAERSSDSSKKARLRLLLLLWDHCIATGVPANTEMESILRFTIEGMPPDLQQELMTGKLFSNDDPKDTVSLQCYRSLRYIGRQWFPKRIASMLPDLGRSQSLRNLERLPSNGHDAITEKTLIDAGMLCQRESERSG